MSHDERYIVAFLALACCSCAASTALVLTPDEDTADVTAEAVRWINFQAGEEIAVVGARGVPVERCAVAGSCGYHSGTRICIERCSDVADLSASVLIHEIGHAFELQHSRYRGSIMAPQLQQLDFEEAARCLVSALPPQRIAPH